MGEGDIGRMVLNIEEPLMVFSHELVVISSQMAIRGKCNMWISKKHRKN